MANEDSTEDAMKKMGLPTTFAGMSSSREVQVARQHQQQQQQQRPSNRGGFQKNFHARGRGRGRGNGNGKGKDSRNDWQQKRKFNDDHQSRERNPPKNAPLIPLEDLKPVIRASFTYENPWRHLEK